MKNYLRIGEIISLHGLKGEVKVYPMTDDIKRFDNLCKFYMIDSKDAIDSDFDAEKTYEKENVKYLKNIVILKIKGLDSIDDSEKLIRKNIYVKRDDAVALKKDEFFIADLIGMLVYEDEMKVGEVVDVMKTKGNDILEIKMKDRDILVPLVDEYIVDIDINSDRVNVKNIEGLI